jgi:ribosomal protein S27AE
MKSFPEKVLWPLVVLALTPSATLLGSKLQSGDWLSWMKKLPSWAYWAFFVVVLGFLLLGAIVRRRAHLRRKNLPFLLPIVVSPRWGYTIVGTLGYKGVVWRTRIPSLAPWEELTLARAQASRVDIETPPRCPKCDTELEEHETFFGNYRWLCLRCGFSAKNEMSYYHEAVRAETIGQSEWERSNAQGG